jgi:RNA polymerase sigma-70 factor (sigma-E family)
MAREEFDEFASGAVTRLYRAAFLMVGNHHQAEDLAQEVLARVYVAWPRISGDPHGYAYRALSNAVANERRWRGRHPEVQLEATDSDRPTAAWEEGVVSRDAVVEALRVLPPRQRAVVVLRYYVDLTEVQTAQALNVSTGTVKSQNAKALARLREAFGDDLDVTERSPSDHTEALGTPEQLTPTSNGSTS